jgi:hypothetical protein
MTARRQHTDAEGAVTVAPGGPDGPPPVISAPAQAGARTEGDLASLHALARALSGAAGTLRDAADGTPAAAFRCVAAADTALAAAPEFFAALEAAVAHGEAAPEVADDLRRYAEQTAALQRQMVPLRARLDELREAESLHRAQAAKNEEIRARIAELERLERLAVGLAKLEDQRGRISERMRQLAPRVSAAEDALAGLAGPLITLTEDVLGNLAERTRAQLLRAREQDELLRVRLTERQQADEAAARRRGELAQAEAAVEQARAEYAAAGAETGLRLSALRKHQAANQDIARALAGQPAESPEQDTAATDPLASAIAALGEVEARLSDIDAMLGAALSQGKD